jgi:hypothetical protein
MVLIERYNSTDDQLKPQRCTAMGGRGFLPWLELHGVRIECMCETRTSTSGYSYDLLETR